MLLIFHCKAIYGTDVPMMAPAVREQGHKIAVVGSIDDHDVGHLDAAFLMLSADDREMCMADRSLRSTQVMLQLLMARNDAQLEDVLLVSAIPEEVEAARNLGIAVINPFVFGRLLMIERTVENVMLRYRESM
jgi:hypothetical protein